MMVRMVSAPSPMGIPRSHRCARSRPFRKAKGATTESPSREPLQNYRHSRAGERISGRYVQEGLGERLQSGARGLNPL